MLQRLWRSIFPSREDSRNAGGTGNRFLRSTLPFHFRPFVVTEKTLRFSLSWGLGGMAATLVLMQMATGILLKFVYVPTPVDAYASVQAIVNQVPFGRMIRNLHCWGANALVIVLMLHMLRVFFTGAFHFPRQFNWIIGLFLLTVVLSANLSGYLLPYDQLAYWAVTVIVAMLGYLPGIGAGLQQALGSRGVEIGPRTLPFFYALHTSVIPIGLVVLMGFHFWRIRKAGGLVVPREPSAAVEPTPTRIAAFPHLLIRETVTALVLVAAMLMVSIFIDAPLAAPANPGISPNPVRAPWYFAGFQELLLHVHPVVAVSAVPMLTTIFLVSIPYLSYPQSTEGIWFASTKGRKQSLVSAMTAILITPILIGVDTHYIKTASWSVNLSPMIRDGLLPLVILGMIFALFFIILKKRIQTTLNERIQFLFTFTVTVFAVLTLVSIVFRGPFMKLIWPW
jgi:quinol-cytochrome oxidoreductase complex cytochrome b subunit